MSRTLWVIIWAVVALIAYDVWTIVKFGYETTISAVTFDFISRFPIVGVGIGCVVGHVAWPNEHACKRLAEKQAKGEQP